MPLPLIPIIIVGGVTTAALGAGGYAADKLGEGAKDAGEGAKATLTGAGIVIIGTAVGVSLILRSPGGRKLLGV